MANLSIAKEFLSHFPWHMIFALREVVPEWEKKEWARVISLSETSSYNSPQRKHWIYFTPNWDYNLSIKNWIWRTQDNAKWIYYFMVDIDATIEDTRSDILEPTFIVKTGKWHHVYYKITDSPFDYKFHAPRWKHTMDALTYLLNWDPACIDIARILRVPWFKYRKDNIWEKDIERVKMDWPSYTFDEVCERMENAWYPYKDIEKEKKKFVNSKRWSEKIIDEINRIDVIDVLERVSWGIYSKHWSNWICEYGKETNGYKYNKRLNFVYSFSPHDDRPKWPPYAIVKFYYHNIQEILEYFRDNYNIDVDNYLTAQKKSYLSARKDDYVTIANNEWEAVLRGVWNFRLRINRRRKEIDYVSSWDKWEQAWLFIKALVEPIWFVYANPEEISKERKIIIRISKWESISCCILPHAANQIDMKRFFMGYWIVMNSVKPWMFDVLLAYLMDTEKEFRYTTKWWLQEINWERYFIRKWGTYFEWDMFVSIKDNKQVFYEEPKDTQLSWEEIAGILDSIYDMDVVYPLFLIGILHVYIYYFRARNIQIPWCFVEWLQQSWKSTIKNFVLKKLLWLKYALAAWSTPFSYIHSAGNYMPVNAEDYRNDAVKDLWWVMNVIRNAFDWTCTLRGTNTLSTVSFQIIWQFIFDWQTKFADTATITRQINLMTTPWKRKALKWYNEIKWNILKKVLRIFPESDDIDEFIDKRYEKYDETMKLLNNQEFQEKSRVVQNYCWLLCLSDKLWLSKYNEYIINAMMDQLKRDEVDEITNMYARTMNLFVNFKWNVDIVSWWSLIEINLEATRMSDAHKDDYTSMCKTINSYFRRNDKWSGLYVDFEYVFKRPTLWNKFRNCMVHARIRELELDGEGVRKSVLALQWFLKQHFKDEDLISDLNVMIQYKWKSGKKSQELPF